MAFIFIFLLPLIVSFTMYVPFFSFSKGTIESWIGFWGSYLGNIIGLVGLSFATYYQIQEQNKLMVKELSSQNKLEKNRIYLEIVLRKFDDYLSFLDTLDKCLGKFDKEYLDQAKVYEELIEKSKFVEQHRELIIQSNSSYDIIYNLGQLSTLTAYLEQENLSLAKSKEIRTNCLKLISDFEELKGKSDLTFEELKENYDSHNENLKEVLIQIQDEKTTINQKISQKINSEFK